MYHIVLYMIHPPFSGHPRVDFCASVNHLQQADLEVKGAASCSEQEAHMSTCQMRLWQDWTTRRLDDNLHIYQVSASIILIKELGIETWVEEQMGTLRSSRRCRGFRKTNEMRQTTGMLAPKFSWKSARTGGLGSSARGVAVAQGADQHLPIPWSLPCSCAPGASQHSDPGSIQPSSKVSLFGCLPVVSHCFLKAACVTRAILVAFVAQLLTCHLPGGYHMQPPSRAHVWYSGGFMN